MHERTYGCRDSTRRQAVLAVPEVSAGNRYTDVQRNPLKLDSRECGTAAYSSDNSDRFSSCVAEELIRVVNRNGLANDFVRPTRIVVQNANNSG